MSNQLSRQQRRKAEREAAKQQRNGPQLYTRAEVEAEIEKCNKFWEEQLKVKLKVQAERTKEQFTEMIKAKTQEMQQALELAKQDSDLRYKVAGNLTTF